MPHLGAPVALAPRRSLIATPAVPILPAPLLGASLVEAATLDAVPDPETLAAWLLERGLQTSSWGQGDTKDVRKFWKEIKLGESGLEVWRMSDGRLQPVRVTHVLRAKVCSPTSYERNVFLFNTWQQFADGRKRNRNGLLSEKLSTEEVPLEEHLHEVCVRAVVQEEMQRVVDAAFLLRPGAPLPEPEGECPLRVEREHFVDYTVEVETSKSFPGLLTMYHLYTVDIVCTGLPGFDFNTLEFEDADGHRKLKYVHAWSWLDWSQIQRYLFEGSELKESKKRGAFKDEGALKLWLSQFDLDLEQWGLEGYRPVCDLFREVEDEETHLELWGRHDGVPLLMRVVHVLQLKVKSADPRLAGKFLFQTWQCNRRGEVRPVNRLMAEKLSTAQMPFDETRFAKAAEDAVQRQLTYLMDVHFQMRPQRLPEEADLTPSAVRITSTRFKSHHHDVEESPSYKGMHTMYHLYRMELVCEGLPLADFTSLDFYHNGGPWANGWHWITWPQTLDALHARTKVLERERAASRKRWCEGRRYIQSSLDSVARLAGCMDRMGDFESAPMTPSGTVEKVRRADTLEEAQELLQELQADLSCLHDVLEEGVGIVDNLRRYTEPVSQMLPPSMVSRMASNTITSDSFLQEAQRQPQRHLSVPSHRPAPPSAAPPARPRRFLGRALALALGLGGVHVILGGALPPRSGTPASAFCLRTVLFGALSLGSLLVF